MARGSVVVEVEIRPTEDPDKVRRAVENIIDPDEVRIEEVGGVKILIAESRGLHGLVKLHRLLRQQRILDAARSVLKKSVQGNRITFYLHKQAALMGKASFVGGDHESPLGAIKVTIEHPDPNAVIDWLAPRTAMGKPLWEREMPE
ncbi:RNA-binding domain-containing protein [Stetteria hydrogenophila]